jgi:hypothetical protein
VDRADEVQLVVDKARNLSVGFPEERWMVTFHGARSSGKTWLSREIEYRLNKNILGPPAVGRKRMHTTVESWIILRSGCLSL